MVAALVHKITKITSKMDSAGIVTCAVWCYGSSGRITRGPGPPERPGGPLETPGLRGYKGASKRPPETTRQIQYMTMQHINIMLSTDGAAPSSAT